MKIPFSNKIITSTPHSLQSCFIVSEFIVIEFIVVEFIVVELNQHFMRIKHFIQNQVSWKFNYLICS